MEMGTIENIIEAAIGQADVRSTMRCILLKVRRYTGFECTAIRIKDQVGDYPYFVHSGFSPDFIETENTLCQRDESGNIIFDSRGKPLLECMCGNILQGRFDPDRPFFTQGGSFWTNSTTELLASTTEEDRRSATRNTCNIHGYESVGLFPMKFDRAIVGLLQLNDRKSNMFTETNIETYESIAICIADVVYHAIITKAFTEAKTET